VGEDATGSTKGEAYLMSFAFETVGRGRDNPLEGASPPAVLEASTDLLIKGGRGELSRSLGRAAQESFGLGTTAINFSTLSSEKGRSSMGIPTFAISAWGITGFDGENSGAVEDSEVFKT
jgi:hypothetical protein